MNSLKTLMYNGIKYFSCLLYTNSLLHFCAPDAKSFSQPILHIEVTTVQSDIWTQTSLSFSYLFPVATALTEMR